LEQIFGIILHSIGGFSSASFYVPSHLVKKWIWQTYWITLGFVAWMMMPMVGGLLTTPDILSVLRDSPKGSMFWTYFFGILWGFGGLMAGLGLRYLGLSLGQSISLGVCSIIGTIVPAIIDKKVSLLFTTVSGGTILLGFMLCLAGIIFCGYAGVLKDRMLTDVQKKESVKEFSAVKGLIFAVLGGIMSGCMAIAIKTGSPISFEAVNTGTPRVFMVLPIYILALGGGFTTNLIYTLIFSFRNKSFGDYIVRPGKTLFRNYFMALISGVMWYGQFFFYGMGTTKMGRFDFASWSIHMASIIIFSNLWGLWLKEWKLVDRKALIWLLTGIFLLIVSVILIGIGNYIAGIA
jgi:L-rhamnose-H+ transport protein